MLTRSGALSGGDLNRSQTAEHRHQRLAWVDVTKGLAIILVVIGHAAAGIIDAAGPRHLPLLRTIFLAIYTFHMPLFFFLSGLFVEQRFARGGVTFGRGLLPSLVWPYFLWSFVQLAVIAVLGSAVNHPVMDFWGHVSDLPVRAVAQFWFLHALILIHLCGFALWRMGGPRAVFGAALLCKLLALFLTGGLALSLAAANFPYYALGLLLGGRLVSQVLSEIGPATRVGAVVLGAGVIVALILNADHLRAWRSVAVASSTGLARIAAIPAMLPAALLGGLSLMIIAVQLERRGGRLTGFIEEFGRHSMSIFLLHVLAIAGARIVLTRLFGVDPLLLLPVLVAAGIGFPLLALRVSQRGRFDQALGLT